jgi:hypothetical protein
MNKLKAILFFILLFTLSNQSKAQITISGKVSDPNDKLVSNALVEIIDQKDSLNKYTATTDASGYFQISNITDIEKYESTLPKEFLILRNYPNPFNPSTIIHFELPKAENIEIKIFDILGREVRSLFSGFHKAGTDQINWDGRNNFNQGVSAGIYLCQLKTKDNFKVHKMVLLDGGTHSSGKVSYQKISNQNLNQLTKVNARFNFTVKVTGDSLDATFFRNLVCTQDTTLNLTVSKIIKTETIGVDGGTIGNDDFKILIPAGAFDGNYNISLIKIEDDGAFGDNTVTPSFKLKGIPSNYAKPINITAKYSGELSEESYMGISKKVYDIINTDSSIVYDLHSAIDSLGYIVSSIPPKPISNLPKSISNFDETDDFEKLIKFLTSYTHSETEHFTIRYPVIYAEKIPLLAQVFEDAFTVVYDGFQMPYSDINRDIIIESIQGPINNKGGYLFNPDLTFYVNKDNVYNLQLNDIQVGAVQGLFLPSDFIYSSNNWVDYAYYFWIEDLISDDPNYKFPKHFLFWGLEAFEGFNTKYRKDFSNFKESTQMSIHGQGMSAIVKYLREFKNMEYSAIGNYYRTRTYQTWISEFLKLVEDPITAWWSDFFKKYLNNELYKLPEDYFIRFAHTEWNINSEQDISKTFTSTEIGTYQDLSAKMFKINLNFADLDNTQNLKFKMMGPDDNKDLSLILFKVINNKLEFIETTQLAEYEIINPKSYFEDGTGEFLAVLVNSNITQEDYLGESEITLQLSVTPKINISDFDLTSNKCIATIAITAELQIETNGSTENKTELLIFGSEHTIGSFVGNTYNGSYYIDGAREGSYFSGEITVTLNAAHDTIVYASFTGLDEDPYWDIRWEKSFTAKNIPISPYENNVFTFQYDNTDVCKSITNVYYYLKQSSVTTYLGHTCDEFSNVYFRFSKE